MIGIFHGQLDAGRRRWPLDGRFLRPPQVHYGTMDGREALAWAELHRLRRLMAPRREPRAHVAPSNGGDGLTRFLRT